MKLDLWKAALVCVVAGLVASTLCFAGNEGSGGGGGYVCGDPSQSELLDLLEAGRTLDLDAPELTIHRVPAPVERQVTRALGRLQLLRRTSVAILDAYHAVRSASKNLVRRAGELAPPNDANSALQEPGCRAMGFIVFNDRTNSLTWDKTNIEHLPNTDQAALWVHEGVYKYLRESKGDTDSRRARLIVAHLFSTETPAQVEAAVLGILGVAPVQPATTDVSAPFPLDGSSMQVFVGHRSDAPDGPVVRVNPEESIDLEGTFSASRRLTEERGGWRFDLNDRLLPYQINVIDELIRVDAGRSDRIDLCDSRLIGHRLEYIEYVAELFCAPGLAALKFHTSDGAVSASWSISSFVIEVERALTVDRTSIVLIGADGALAVSLNDSFEITHVEYFPPVEPSFNRCVSDVAQLTLCENTQAVGGIVPGTTAILDLGSDTLIRLAKAVKSDLSPDKKAYLQSRPITR